MIHANISKIDASTIAYEADLHRTNDNSAVLVNLQGIAEYGESVQNELVSKAGRVNYWSARGSVNFSVGQMTAIAGITEAFARREMIVAQMLTGASQSEAYTNQLTNRILYMMLSGVVPVISPNGTTLRDDEKNDAQQFLNCGLAGVVRKKATERLTMPVHEISMSFMYQSR